MRGIELCIPGSESVFALFDSLAPTSQRVHTDQMGERVPGPVQAIAEWLLFPTKEQNDRECRPWPVLAEEVTALFCDFRRPLLRYTLTLGLPVQDGEDIVQEVFLCLFRHLMQGKSRQNLRGWIFKVTHNLALKRRWKNQRLTESSIGDFVELTIQDPSLNPEEQVARNRRQACFWAVMQALPERDRCCLSLRAEGLQYRDIARTLGISLGSVALSLSRSMAKLSRAVER